MLFANWGLPWPQQLRSATLRLKPLSVRRNALPKIQAAGGSRSLHAAPPLQSLVFVLRSFGTTGLEGKQQHKDTKHICRSVLLKEK